jgi:hypothetical protein
MLLLGLLLFFMFRGRTPGGVPGGFGPPVVASNDALPDGQPTATDAPSGMSAAIPADKDGVKQRIASLAAGISDERWPVLLAEIDRRGLADAASEAGLLPSGTEAAT